MKGRTVRYQPRVNNSREATLPACDLALADGRVLCYGGLSQPVDAGGVFIRLAAWMCNDGLKVLASLDPLHISSKRRFLHLSISRPDRYPDWDEMKQVCDLFFGQDVDAAMIKPRKSDYVNVHNWTFHWWEMPVEWGLW